MSALINAEVMYDLWLSGLSIRKIAAINNIGRGRCWKMLTSKYGKDACNLRKQSLARVVYQEYGDRELAEKARGTDGLFRSEKTMRNYSNNNSSLSFNEELVDPEVLIDYISVTDYRDNYEDIEDTEVTLKVYLWICEMTSRAIMQCIIHNQRVELRAMRGDCRD